MYDGQFTKSAVEPCCYHAVVDWLSLQWRLLYLFANDNSYSADMVAVLS
jgi:hypothetical protein